MKPNSGALAPSFAPHAVLFDLDGLLVDSEPIWQEAERILMKAWGAEWTEEDAVASRGTGIPETARRMAVRAARPFDERRDPAALVQTFLGLAPAVRVKPGGRELLERARASGVGTAVASSSPRRIVETVLGAHRLQAYFDTIVTGDDVQNKKPDPEIFLVAAKRLRVEPASCLVLEDSMPGVLAAKCGSIPVIAVPEVDAASFVGIADAVARDLIEAAAWIELTRSAR